MEKDYFDKLLRTESVFRPNGQKTLAQAWVPDRDQKLLCRDKELKQLISIHRPIIESDEPFSVNTLILGKGGIGKTITVKYFGARLREVALKNKRDLFIEYYDCLQHRSKSSILRDIAQKLMKYTTGHGFADSEILKEILLHLSKERKYVLIILDEVQNLSQDDIMAFVNASIGFGQKNSRFSLLLISRKNDWLRIENERIMSRIQHKIEFNPYTKDEAYTILEYRRNLAFRSGVLEDEELELIADIVATTKNMRNGIEIMYRCGIWADTEGLSRITAEMIRKARKDISDPINQTVIFGLKDHEKLALLAVARALHQKDDSYVLVEDAYPVYQMVCEEFGQDPHVIMSFRKHLRKLRELNLLVGEYINPSNENKGRKLKVGLYDIPADSIIEFLEPRLTYLKEKK